MDVKADWMAWRTHNICVEGASLHHTRSTFIYMLPRPSGIYFHVFPVQKLRSSTRRRTEQAATNIIDIRSKLRLCFLARTPPCAFSADRQPAIKMISPALLNFFPAVGSKHSAITMSRRRVFQLRFGHPSRPSYQRQLGR
jgi:hypothetical protein